MTGRFHRRLKSQWTGASPASPLGGCSTPSRADHTMTIPPHAVPCQDKRATIYVAETRMQSACAIRWISQRWIEVVLSAQMTLGTAVTVEVDDALYLGEVAAVEPGRSAYIKCDQVLRRLAEVRDHIRELGLK